MDNSTEKRIGRLGQFIDHGDGTVTDTRSGLMWMRVAMGITLVNGVVSGTVRLLNFSTAQSIHWNFGRYKDWRLPTIDEFKNLIEPELSPVLDDQAFPAQSIRYFWSSSVRYGTPLIISLITGQEAEGRLRDEWRPVQFVRSITAMKEAVIPTAHQLHQTEIQDTKKITPTPTIPEIPQDLEPILTHSPFKRIGRLGQFIDHDDGTVTDTNTGLMWKRAAEGQSWENGRMKGECSEFYEASHIQQTFAGHSDWRAPTCQELMTIVDKTRNAPCIDLNVFPKTQNDRYMSSTQLEYPRHMSYFVNFCSGTPIIWGKTGGFYLRLVRGKIQRQKIILLTTGSGTGNVECNPALLTYEFGSTVSLLARASEDSIFVGWQGDMTGDDASCKLTMDAPKSVTAVFQLREFFALQIVMSGTGTGTTECFPSLPKYEKGSFVTLKATPAASSEFIDWIGDGRKVDKWMLIN